jgi:hypothetical protein
MRSAARLEGPWSDPVVALDTRPTDVIWTYDAQAHAEFSTFGGEGGRIQSVTYSRVTSEFESAMQFVQVELGLL